MSGLASWWRRLLHGPQPPAGFDGTLAADERLLSAAAVGTGGHLVATTLGLWLPQAGGPHRRAHWHLISKATWDGQTLTVVEADEVGTEDTVVLIADRPPRRFGLPQPADLPAVVHARVTRSVLHSEPTDGGGLAVQRRVPGRDGVQRQLRRPTS